MSIDFEKLFLELEIRNTSHDNNAFKSYGAMFKCSSDLNYYDGNRIIINKINFSDFKDDYISLNMKHICIIKNNETDNLISNTALFSNKVDHGEYFIMKRINNTNIVSKLDVNVILKKTRVNVDKYIEVEKEVQLIEYNEIYKSNVLETTVNNENTLICIINYENKPIGLFYYFKDINVIESVYTFKQYRCNNIMGYAIQEFCDYYNVDPYLYCGNDVVKFYEKIGFEKVGSIKYISSVNNEELYDLILNYR